jgi:hypothetical protein
LWFITSIFEEKQGKGEQPNVTSSMALSHFRQLVTFAANQRRGHTRNVAQFVNPKPKRRTKSWHSMEGDSGQTQARGPIICAWKEMIAKQQNRMSTSSESRRGRIKRSSKLREKGIKSEKSGISISLEFD